jgi:hypothetical protein
MTRIEGLASGLFLVFFLLAVHAEVLAIFVDQTRGKMRPDDEFK